MNTYLICSAVLVLLYFLLAFNVSLTRGSLKIGIGTDSPSGKLNKAIRAHGNSSEYIPIFVLLFLYFNAIAAGGWITWVVIAATVFRVLHPIAILLSPDLNKAYAPRFIASLGTYLCGLALGVALLTCAAV
jgi:hypothetical protein